MLSSQNKHRRPSVFILLGCLLALSLALAGCGPNGGSGAAASASNTASASAAAGNGADNGAGNANNTSASSNADTSAQSGETGTRTLTDAMGHEVQIPAEPTRIIAPFLEDPLTAMGIRPAAQWSAAGNPQQYLQGELQSVPPLNMDNGLKAEEVLGYNPDLIILSDPSYLKATSYEAFSKIAPTFVLSTEAKGWREVALKLGEVLGKESEAEAALKKHDDEMASAKEQIHAAVGDKTAVLLQGNDEKGYKLFGPNFYGGAVLYQELGFKQPELLKGDYELYSVETLPELQNVDYIFVLSGAGRAKPPENNSLWKNLPAVKEGHVFPVDSGHWFNQNVIADEKIAEDVLHDVVQ